MCGCVLEPTNNSNIIKLSFLFLTSFTFYILRYTLLNPAFFNFITISNKFFDVGGNKFKNKIDIFHFFTCFIKKVRHFVLFGKINLPIGNKKIDNRYFNFMSGHFCWVGGDVNRKIKKCCMVLIFIFFLFLLKYTPLRLHGTPDTILHTRTTLLKTFKGAKVIVA